MGYTATATGTDANTYTAVASSRNAALAALAMVIPAGVQVLTHTIQTVRGF